MPSGRIHDRINIFVLVLIFFSYLSLFNRSVLPFPASYLETRRMIVFSLAYLFGTFFLSPDLDTRSIPFHRWGVLKVIWLPYQLLGHRKVLHHPIFGPMVLTLTPVVLLYFFLSLLSLDAGKLPSWILASTLFGLFVPIEIHCLSDLLWGKIFRRYR